MTTRAWRIFKPKWESSAFSGEGAKRSGGRWNSRGTAMVYTSQSSSLAILELTVHLDSGIKASLHYRLCEVEIEDDLILTLDLTSLPTNWKDVPAPFALQQIGDEWVRDHSSAVLRVPSAVNEKGVKPVAQSTPSGLQQN